VLQDLNRVVQRMKYCGGTFSGYKSVLCSAEITVLGHRCTIDGRLPDPSRVNKIINWAPCQDLSDVRAFLGTIGLCRLYIKNFAHRVHHLVKLTRKDVEWEFGQEQLDAMKDLKDALLASPALKPIDYTSNFKIQFKRFLLNSIQTLIKKNIFILFIYKGRSTYGHKTTARNTTTRKAEEMGATIEEKVSMMVTAAEVRLP
jgi:hypothetical protein